MGMFRKPRTMNEKRWYYASLVNEPDIPVKVRGNRRPDLLPDEWDDMYPSNYGARCWKAYRKRQWKEKTGHR